MENNPSPEEYIYSEESYADAFPVKKPSMLAQLMSMLRRQRAILVVIGVVIIIYIVVRVSSVIDLNKKRNTTFYPVKSQVALQTGGRQTEANAMALVQQAAGVRKKDEEVQLLGTQLQNGMANLDSKLYNMQQGMSGLNDSMQRMETILQQQLAIQKAEWQMRLQQKQHAAAETYTVYAIVSNRAWLLNARGETLTVAPGTLIPGVGIVKVVNQTQGTVTTDTGVVLRFTLSDT